MAYSVIGKSVKNIQAIGMVTGQAHYTVDIELPGMLCGKIKRSPHPYARIASINISKAGKLPGVKAVITAQTVTQFPFGPFIRDQLPLAREYVRYIGDEVVAVAAVDEETAEDALSLVEVEYERLEPVLDMGKATAPNTPAVHPELENISNNIAYHIEYVRGEGAAALARADLVLSERFSTQEAYQAYLEPQACVCQWESSGRLTIWCSSQNPFRHRMELALALGIPEHRIRVRQPHVGGGFGGKTALLPLYPICALLSKEAVKPVKMVLERSEDFISGRPRVPEDISLTLGFQRDGSMVAKEAVITANAGAYAGLCPSLLSVSAIRPDCVYRLPNIKMAANLVYTNTIPHGPFRGYGNPQMLFAMESLIDIAAEKLGLDPIELRLKNATQKGDTTQHGWIINSCGLGESLRRAAEASGWREKRQKKVAHQGIGVACQVHVSGNRAVHPLYDGSAALVRVDQYGKVQVVSGEGEIGQGAHTVFAQIAAEELGVPVEEVEVLPVDSDVSPICQGAFASRVTTVGGNAVMRAARDAREQLKSHAAKVLAVSPDRLELKDGKVYVDGSPRSTIGEVASKAVYRMGGLPIIGKSVYTVPDYVVVPDRKTLYGNYSIGYSFSTQIAEVLVDPETGRVEVLDIWVAEDIGKAINPKACEGQTEGGVAQGMGFALTEEYLRKDGAIQNPSFTDYRLPVFTTVPRVHLTLIETIEPGGPYGAKSIGEAVLNPVAPAIANAVYNAIGVRLKDLPLTAEKVLKALKEKTVRTT
ncbi:MAG: xanthine dehydrogenase family protein molybdopterin-binding subunit [Chloroflexota bacterium]